MKIRFRLFKRVGLYLIISGGLHLAVADVTNPKAPDVKTQSASQGGIAPSGSADNFLFTGSFLYNIPIDVPPGLEGVQPALALQYNSSQGNGIAGVGWDLSLGSIQRSLKNGVPKYNSSDLYVLNLKGQTQELTSVGTDGSGNFLFRSKIEDSYMKFVQSSNGSQWTVYDKAGTQYYFGETSSARIQGTPGIFLWALDKVVDRNGNAMTVSYTTGMSADQNQLYPQDILYTSNATTNPQRVADRKVHFTFQSRPDPILSYRSGLSQVMAQRLLQIDTYVYQNNAWTVVKTYPLIYGTGSLRVRSQLQLVRMQGKDGTTVLEPIPTNVSYNQTGSGWTSASNPPPPMPYPSIILNDGNGIQSIDYGVRFVDLNGDGRVDMLVGRAESNASGGSGNPAYLAYLNTPTGWQDVSATWKPPVAFSYFYWGNSAPANFSRDNGVRIADINGDGRPDIVQALAQTSWNATTKTYSTTYTQKVWINTGSGWDATQGAKWVLPANLAFLQENINSAQTRTVIDNGIQLIDINGDGYADFVQGKLVNTTSTRATWINTGTGWTQNNSWNLPTDLIWGDNSAVQRQTGAIIVDLNGDGLPDIIQSCFNAGTNQLLTNKIWLNTGPGWVDATATMNWSPPDWTEVVGNPMSDQRDQGVQFVDVNGDGLPDWVESLQEFKGGVHNFTGTYKKVFLNTGSGWVDASSSYALPFPFVVINVGDSEFNTYTTGALFLDLNGDGQPDLVESNVHNNQTTSSIWLSNATPELAQTITTPIGGKLNLQYDCSLHISGTHTLPYPIEVLTKIDQLKSFGVIIPSLSTSYSYDQGLYDFGQKEFLGFGKVKTTDAQGNYSQTYYLQNKDADGNVAPANCFKGRVYKTESYNAGNTLLASQQTRWDMRQPISNTSVYFMRPTSEKSTLFDVSPNQISETDFVYDETVGSPTYGNILKTVFQGDTAVSGDERTETVDYAVNTTSNLLSFPKRSAVYAADGMTKLSETLFYYDGTSDSPMSFGNLSKGNITQVQKWLNLPTSRYITTKTDYNGYGQVTSIKDANGNQATTTYDAFGYLSTVKNALNQTVQSTYDPRYGNVMFDTDINNQTTKYSYDALGRLLKVVGPLDTDSTPSVQYDYHDEVEGNPAAQNVEKHVKEHYSDSAFLWTKTFFDGLGWVYETQQSDIGSQIVQTDTQFDNRGLPVQKSLPHFTADAAQWVQTSYDALGRVVRVQTPANQITSTVFQGRTAFVTDPNGHTQSSVSDAYGHVIQRNEPSISLPTYYGYDALGNLTQLTDSQGKITGFTYDSLSRKIAMADPNAGAWSYSYDDVGNLSQQTDARGVVLSLQYDGLNRLKARTLTADPQNQTGQSLGLLTSYFYDQIDSHRPYSLGHLTSVVDSNGITTNFFHDQVGRVTHTSKQVGTNTYDIYTQYDALSRTTQIQYPNNAQVNYGYDAAGHLASVTDGGGNTLASYPPYDAQGRPSQRQQDNNLLRTFYTYDPLQQTLSTLRTESGPTTSASVLQNLGYQFDLANNLKSITDALNSSRNQSFSYDSLNRLITASGEYGSQTFGYDALGNFTTKDQTQYAYESAAHPYVVTRTYAPTPIARDASTILAWNFDPSEPIYSVAGTVTKSNVPTANVPVLVTGLLETAIQTSSSGTYVVQGLAGNYNVAASSSGMMSAPLSYAYNPLSANQSNLNFSLSVDTTTPLNFNKLRIPRTAIVSGDANPNQSGGTYTGGGFVGMPFGGTWSLSGATTNYSGYAPLSDGNDLATQSTAQYVLSASSVGQGVIGPTFVPGRYQQALKFNGATDIFIYPNTQSLAPTALTLMMWVKPSTNPISGWSTLIAKSSAVALGQLADGFRLVQLPSGKVSFEIGKSGGSISLISASQLPANKWTYVNATYDGQTMRIYFNGDEDASVATTVPIVSNNYAVVTGGQLNDLKREVAGTFFQGILDEPRIQNRAWSEGEILDALASYDMATFTYDNNGNQITKTNGDVTWNYQFDAQGRLTQVKSNGTSIAQFLYDGDGGRVEKITPAGNTIYIGSLYEEGADKSRVDHVFANGQPICDIWSLNSSSETYYYSADHLGSTTLVTDSHGNLKQQIHYDPFGDIFSTEGDSPVHHKYTAQENDPETGLNFYQARYYDPVLGRFISPDSMVPNAMDPQSLNRYAYVRNNPVNYADPTGHSWLSHEIDKVNHWADHNAVGSTIIGSLFPSIGIPLMDRTNTGRDILAGAIIVGTSLALPGGGAVAWGALSGELVGGYSAYQAGGSILSGVAVGGTVGAGTGYLGSQIGTAAKGALGSTKLSYIIGGAVRGAIIGAGTGGVAGYKGGEGDFDSVWEGVYRGAAIGGALGAGFGAVQYKPGDTLAMRPDEVLSHAKDDVVKGGWQTLAKDFGMRVLSTLAEDSPNAGYALISDISGFEEIYHTDIENYLEDHNIQANTKVKF